MGLRSKCYSLMVQEKSDRGEVVEKQKNTAAGVKMSAKDSLKHEVYRNTLFQEEDKMITQNLLRSYKHQVHSVTQTKVGLTAYDDKRYLVNGVTTRAHGHYLNTTKD